MGWQNELRRMFPGICFYIVEGPDVTEDDLSFWVLYLGYSTPDASGTTVGSTATGTDNYRASEVAKASMRGMPKKIGPAKVGIYDPELASMIGMDI